MRLPSTKTIQDGLRCPVQTARRIRRRLETYRASTKEAPVNALMAIDGYLSGADPFGPYSFGVEYLPSRQDTCREAEGIHYVNMGDPYAPTVYYDYASGRFYVGSWGSVVEAYPRRFDEG